MTDEIKPLEPVTGTPAIAPHVGVKPADPATATSAPATATASAPAIGAKPVEPATGPAIGAKPAEPATTPPATAPPAIGAKPGEPATATPASAPAIGAKPVEPAPATPATAPPATAPPAIGAKPVEPALPAMPAAPVVEPEEPARPPTAERLALKPEGKRLFVGVRLSTAASNALAKAAEMLARRAREGGIELKWVAPTNYHLTLKFLGWTRIETIRAIEDALDAATRGTQRITFRTARLGGFPSLDKASVLWAGVEDGGALGELGKRIETAMTGIGYAAETRPFHPHVTLARMRETRLLKEVVLPVAEQMFGDTRIEAVTLFESETKSSGSVYREISRIEFKQPETTAERQTRAVDLGASNQTNESEDTDDGWPRGQGPNH